MLLAWTAEATFLELPEKKWRERHFVCFGFVSYQRCFLHSQPPLCTAELSFVFLLVWLFIFCCLFGFRGVSAISNGNGNEYNGCVSVRYNSLFISLPLFTKVHKTTTSNRHTPHICERELYDGQFLKFLSRILKLSYIFCLGFFRQYRMNSNYRELLRLNVKSVARGQLSLALRCCRCCLNCLLLLWQRTSACTFDYLFVRLPSLCLRVCLLCTLLSRHFSAVHSVVLVCAGYIHIPWQTPLKFRNVFELTESRGSFACNQTINVHISTVLEVLICFETKRKRDINSTKTCTQRAIQLNPRKNWVQCHSLTLIISCCLRNMSFSDTVTLNI